MGAEVRVRNRGHVRERGDNTAQEEMRVATGCATDVALPILAYGSTHTSIGIYLYWNMLILMGLFV